MDIIGPELKSLLQKQLENEEENYFDSSTVIQELVLPMMERWTNVISFNQQNSLKSWSDLFSVLDALPAPAIKLCMCTEYLLDIILQHVQIDVYETDISIWLLASKCFLLLLENCGAVVWRETGSNSNDFIDNLLDIYQSTETSRGIAHRVASSSKSLSHTLLLVEIMIGMVLNSPEPAVLQSFTTQVAHCISNLMSHFQLNHNSMTIDNKKTFDVKEGIHNDSKKNSKEQILQQKDHLQVLQSFNEIICNYLTENTKKCRSLLLTDKSQEDVDEYDILYEDQSDDIVYIKNQSDVEYLKTKKTKTDCFTILQELLSIICRHDDLFHYPDIMNHISSCHSCLCIVPQLEGTCSKNSTSNNTNISLSSQLSELHIIITNLLIRICNCNIAVNVSNMLSYLPGMLYRKK